MGELKTCYEPFSKALDLDVSFGMTSAAEKGREIWRWDCEKMYRPGSLNYSGHGISEVYNGSYKKWDGGAWSGLIWLRIGCTCGNEPSSSIKCGEFLE